MQPVLKDVCVVDAVAAERARLVELLRGAQLSVIETEDAEQAVVQVRVHHPRVVICDLELPGMSGTDLCRHLRNTAGLDGTYLIVLTQAHERSAKNEALSSGADDYLVKPCDQEELLARIRNGIRTSKLQERLRHAAVTDGLTGLWNHTQFRELLDAEFARTRRYGGVSSLLMLDLDHFKAVNDTYGHENGNLVLEATAHHLQRLVRDSDVVARYGGEEFAVICPATGVEDAARLAQRIRQTISDHVRLPHCPQLTITASVGVAATDDPHVNSVRDLIDQADQALYVAKHRGRNTVIRADELEDTPATRREGAAGGEVDRLQKQVISLSMQAKELCLQSVWALVQALEARDPFTAWHSRNTTCYVTCLADSAGLPAALRGAVANAAMLHDLGKIGVPDQILESAEALTPDQQAILRQVPLMTCKILEPLRVFETETLIIRHLRERYDGAGYPLGLAGRSIPIGSRLLAVAETFDALTSERPHRRSCTYEEALRLITDEAGRQFDPHFANLLGHVAAEQQEQWQQRIARARADVRTCSTAHG